MTAYETFDGSPEDVAAFVNYLGAQGLPGTDQHPSLLTELYAAEFLRWRVTRFFYEGLPVVTILQQVHASDERIRRAMRYGVSAVNDLLDRSMEPYVQAFIDGVLAATTARTPGAARFMLAGNAA